MNIREFCERFDEFRIDFGDDGESDIINNGETETVSINDDGCSDSLLTYVRVGIRNILKRPYEETKDILAGDISHLDISYSSINNRCYILIKDVPNSSYDLYLVVEPGHVEYQLYKGDTIFMKLSNKDVLQ